MQPDGNHHCIQFWRTGQCQWSGRCRFPHQCYLCGSSAHGTGQHAVRRSRSRSGERKRSKSRSKSPAGRYDAPQAAA